MEKRELNAMHCEELLIYVDLTGLVMYYVVRVFLCAFFLLCVRHMQGKSNGARSLIRKRNGMTMTEGCKRHYYVVCCGNEIATTHRMRDACDVT